MDFLRDFAEMSRFGATPAGGVHREAATPADGQTRGWFIDWLNEHGFRVEIDAIGNVFGLLDLVAGAPYVLTGSHLDSQPMAGRFDGAYGVLASAHAARRVADAVRDGSVTPAYNLAVVDWFNEEGSRFPPSMMGSAVFTGLLPLETALNTTDRHGVSVAQALDRIDGRGGFAGPRPVAYAEIHVEQGRSLEDEQATIGLVDRTWTARKLDVVVHGEQAHTGAARMADRRDALYGAARLIVAARDLVRLFEVEELHTAVAELTVEPNSPVAIAREVRLLVDVRSPRPEILDSALARLHTDMEAIAREANVELEIVRTVEWSSGPFLEEGIRITQEEAARRGLRAIRVATVAGHDATNVKDIAPTVLVFVPSVDGLSHNEREFTEDADLLAGVEVFTGVLARLCAGELDAGQDDR